MVRLAYWTGAVMVVPLLAPSVAGAMFGINHFSPARRLPLRRRVVRGADGRLDGAAALARHTVVVDGPGNG
ncbi:hypothetical protein MSAS_02130 [Mycobacterium saskatchewanense]|uniref:Uncharacterized protein n=1 Tax=Mycobacterium saskatchewanense TaxID=220927 RepID=A0AAJ3NNQ1_9MYCO|nr:hypothetical protein [Mycobacterium saskatchewanense]ORW69593.1 hypothetical protein AWC23_01530 [Mycobacterium saskatchewanense]BBX61039.1 hypothetical protein MSAS_02130 [Mycobacterium saskatchewanense]